MIFYCPYCELKASQQLRPNTKYFDKNWNEIKMYCTCIELANTFNNVFRGKNEDKNNEC